MSDGEEHTVASLALHMQYMRKELEEHREEARKSADEQRVKLDKVVVAINGDGGGNLGLVARVRMLENSNSGIARFVWIVVAAIVGGLMTAVTALGKTGGKAG